MLNTPTPRSARWPTTSAWPRDTGQTPYEFIDSFPKELRTLREESEELTRLYVVAAYSPSALDDRVLDRVRKFWTTYARVATA